MQTFNRHEHLLSLLVPAFFLVAFALASQPFMYPGFDIWTHLALMSFEDDATTTWHILWKTIFEWAEVEGPFLRAKWVHSTQIILMGGLLFFAARWLLQLAMAGCVVRRSALNLAAWLAVLVWVLMHGTQSTAVNADTPVWYGWLQWYSVNYQIALAFYVFGAAALLFAFFGSPLHPTGFRAWTYGLAAGLAFVGVAVLHAAELPYVFLAVLLMGVLWMRWSWRWYYLAGVIGIFLVSVMGLQFSYRLPTGLLVLMQDGPGALLLQIQINGQRLVDGLNRGNASWNYWYWVTCYLTLLSAWWVWRQPALAQRDQRIRVILWLLLSALPAAMLHFKWTAGLLAMITYPELAWRFTFSSFLFLGPSIFFLLIAHHGQRALHVGVMLGLSASLILGVLLTSRAAEKQSVSYLYARGLVYSLDPKPMRFGLDPAQAAWLDQVHLQLIKEPPARLLCTDMFTSYYLFFVKGYEQVVLPWRIGRFIDSKRFEGKCKFPKDGGAWLGDQKLAPTPWAF
jgi:hypothetical protein